MRQLGWPTLFCHRLITDDEGRVTDYKLRQTDPKRASVKALHSLNYRVIAAGDSYNVTTMLAQAEARRKSRYLAAHIRPTLAETAEYPRRLVLMALVAFFSFGLWTLGVLIYYSVRDRR